MKQVLAFLTILVGSSASAQFMPLQTIYQHHCTFTARPGATADLDGDGLMDIVRTCDWLKNDGQGSYLEMSTWDQSYILGTVFAADIDEDGDNDLVASSASQVFLLENDGLGNFEIFPTTNHARGVMGLGDGVLAQHQRRG